MIKKTKLITKRVFFIPAFFIAAVFMFGFAFFCYDFNAFINRPLFSDAPKFSEAIMLQVPAKTSLKQLSQKLGELGIFSSTKQKYYFEWLTKLHQASGMLKAGEYELLASDTPKILLQNLINGKVMVYGFTIIEGWSFQDILEALAKHPKLQKNLKELSAAEIIQKLNLPLQPEGWLYPATYYFSLGFSDEAVLKKAHQFMHKILSDEWQNRAPNLSIHSAYESLILASIIEKETALVGERKRISGVYQLRLKSKMRLQADPTVLYGLYGGVSAHQKALSKNDLQQDTPYNTYKRSGLPPSPIAAPSLTSIRAACQPDFQGELYFVATGHGGHYFSKNLNEHYQAVQKYQLNKNK